MIYAREKKEIIELFLHSPLDKATKMTEVTMYNIVPGVDRLFVDYHHESYFGFSLFLQELFSKLNLTVLLQTQCIRFQSEICFFVPLFFLIIIINFFFQ